MDIEQARFNMIEQQVRTWEVLDQDVLDLLFAVRREEFVPAAYRALAFADLEIPLPGGAKMWTPKMEARVASGTQAQAGRECPRGRHWQRLPDGAHREHGHAGVERRDRPSAVRRRGDEARARRA